jgi:hypothetical protein
MMQVICAGSSWFTNRKPIYEVTIPELRRGARTHGEPQPPFTVAAKTEGVTPGFGIREEPRAGRLRVLRMIGR